MTTISPFRHAAGDKKTNYDDHDDHDDEQPAAYQLLVDPTHLHVKLSHPKTSKYKFKITSVSFKMDTRPEGP